jgi:hypothetical protein
MFDLVMKSPWIGCGQRNYIIQMELLHELEEINNKKLSMQKNSEEV